MDDKDLKSVLIIEDEEALRRALRLKFETLNYHVFTAADGEEGLQSAIDNHPTVILLDIMMPNIDGFSMLEMVKSKDDLKDIPVLLLTNLGQEEDEKRGRELGAVEYIIKAETSLEDIVNIVKKYL